jgi:hypothetical protein
MDHSDQHPQVTGNLYESAFLPFSAAAIDPMTLAGLQAMRPHGNPSNTLNNAIPNPAAAFAQLSWTVPDPTTMVSLQTQHNVGGFPTLQEDIDLELPGFNQFPPMQGTNDANAKGKLPKSVSKVKKSAIANNKR